MEAAMGTQQTVRTEHPVELVWGRGCSPGLEPRLSQPQHPLSYPELSLNLTSLTGPSRSVLIYVQIGLSCVQSNVIITVPWPPSVWLRVSWVCCIQLTCMQSFEEVYDHLVSVRTGPERLASFSRSHSCVEEKQEFDLNFCPCTIHHPSIDSGGG